MYFSKSVIAVMASLLTMGLAADPLSFTSWPKDPLQAGKPVTLTWTGAVPDRPVTILLRQGSSGNLKDVKAITAEARDGTFTWTPDSDIKEGQTYAFQIWQGDETNYTALLKSAGKPMADAPEAHETAASASTTTGGTTSAHAHTTAGSTTAPQPTQATQATQVTQATQTTLTSTGSKALISSSAHPSGSPSGSPSSSATASSTETSSVAGTEIVNNKEASSTDSPETGAASTPQIPVQLAMGVVGILAYLV